MCCAANQCSHVQWEMGDANGVGLSGAKRPRAWRPLAPTAPSHERDAGTLPLAFRLCRAQHRERVEPLLLRLVFCLQRGEGGEETYARGMGACSC